MLYIVLMFIGLVLMLQTGALGALNECLIPALGEMWGDSRIDRVLFTLIGHDDTADRIEARLEYAAFDAAEPQRNSQWVHDLLVAVEATTPRIIGVTVGQFLAGVLPEPQPRLRWSVERAPVAPRKKPVQPTQEPQWLTDWLAPVQQTQATQPKRRRRTRARV